MLPPTVKVAKTWFCETIFKLLLILYIAVLQKLSHALAFLLF